MKDSMKVVIGLGSIWGLFVAGAILLGFFTLGGNDTTLEVVAMVASGIGMLPCCLLAIWRQRLAGLLLAGITAICACGFSYQLLA